MVETATMNAREIIRLLEEDGWYLKVQKGSHAQYVHLMKKGKVTVPIHGKKNSPLKL